MVIHRCIKVKENDAMVVMQEEKREKGRLLGDRTDLHFSIHAKEDVVALDVTMNDGVCMKELKSLQNLRPHIHDMNNTVSAGCRGRLHRVKITSVNVRRHDGCLTNHIKAVPPYLAANCGNL